MMEGTLLQVEQPTPPSLDPQHPDRSRTASSRPVAGGRLAFRIQGMDGKKSQGQPPGMSTTLENNGINYQ